MDPSSLAKKLRNYSNTGRPLTTRPMLVTWAFFVLAKIQPKTIRDEELKIIAQEIQKHANPHRYKYDVKKNIITVYEINQDIERLSEFLQFADKAKVEKHLLENATYSPIMRFILEHKEKRLFVTERFCFRGSVDDWIYIGGPDSLSQEAKKFIKHLGKESFFEL